MNSVILQTIIIIGLLPSWVSCHLYPEEVYLIKRLNDFFRFDHHIYFVDSSVDLDRWLQMPSSSVGTKWYTQTVYTFDDFSDGGFNITEQEAVKDIASKKTFLVAVVDVLKCENNSQLYGQVEAIRQLDKNVKVGVFLTRSIESLDIVDQLFRWSWSVGIVNIFSAFNLHVEGDEPTFNVFNYDPFGTFDLINVTRSESIQDYFPDKRPNYRKHPLRFFVLREHESANTVIEIKFWDTVSCVFNASLSAIFISQGEPILFDSENVDVYSHEVIGTGLILELYPHRQAKLVMIVPHAQPYSDIFAYLRNGTWTLLFVYAFFVIVTSSFLLIVSSYLRKEKILLFQCVSDVINLLINDNSTIRYQNLHRADVFVTVPLTFTGLIVMNGIVSIFQSYITSPIYQPQINSLRDLYTSSVPILANEIEWRDVFSELLEDLSKYEGWSGKIHGISMTKLAKEVGTFNNSIAFFTFDHDVEVILEVQQRLALEAYHSLRDTFFARYLFTYLVSYEFPFIEHINELVHRFNGAGLIEQWVKEYNEEKIKSWWKRELSLRIKISNELDVEKFSVPSVVWCGWIASAIVFICEIIWNKVKLHLYIQQAILTRIRQKIPPVPLNISIGQGVT